MRYLNESVWGSITPKCYVRMSVSFGEVVESSLEPQYARVISVGSAEGYFAVGYPWRNPAYEVFCFDIDPVSRQQVRRLAKMSGVSKRVILNRLLVGHVLTVMDVEGYETILLDTEKVLYLAHTDMLVGLHEVHGGDQETVEVMLRARFADTYRITRYSGTGRWDWTEANRTLCEEKLSQEELLQSVDEGHRISTLAVDGS
jgi:predicted O-methyltransferase YrrM